MLWNCSQSHCWMFLADLLLFIRNAFCHLSMTCLWFCQDKIKHFLAIKYTFHLTNHCEDFSVLKIFFVNYGAFHWFVLTCPYVRAGGRVVMQLSVFLMKNPNRFVQFYTRIPGTFLSWRLLQISAQIQISDFSDWISFDTLMTFIYWEIWQGRTIPLLSL